ncbi:ABC transporter ATP-binding protein [Pseudodesulfovibrio sp.]|uniref:ABC transporter ATP-binding protein n=1 Tax=Pseudodesulfovibrio sp. TaxID=2035812 RepID=UPI0026286811|nr:ABC transporter ATP-binding protein [Pseudodesulfovibrio sp.]MDD3313313.1 ABC transporter ATP-binding protein [Pseudodesulfovibrio sp.]
MEPIISVKGISKRYSKGSVGQPGGRVSFLKTLLLPGLLMGGKLQSFRGEESFWALKDIHFDVMPGERLGIIGRNGAGKTTLLRILSKLVLPTEGEAVIRGRSTALFGVGVGFRPMLTGRENIYLESSIHGLNRKETEARIEEIIQFSGLQGFIDTPIKYYSKGMVTRLAFSVAAFLEPDILMLDEVFSGGDIAFQKQCLSKMDSMAMGGRALIFVSHSLNEVCRLCEKAIWLEGGRIVEMGDSRDVTQAYSKRMLKLVSSLSVKAERPKPISPEVLEKTEQGGFVADRSVARAVLLGASLTNGKGEKAELFYREEPVNIRIEFEVLYGDVPVVPIAHILKDGVHVFSTHPEKTVQECGVRHVSSVRIPPHFFNTGEFSVTVALVTPARPKWRHIFLENALSFQVVEAFDGDKLFSGEYRGVVKPLFDWDNRVEPLDDPEPSGEGPHGR